MSEREDRARRAADSAASSLLRSIVAMIQIKINGGIVDDAAIAIEPGEAITRAILAFANAELERAAEVAESARYSVRHPTAGMDHEMQTHDDACMDIAESIRKMMEE